MNIVITGASRGLGKALAIRFANAGHDLYLTSRKMDALQNTAEQIANDFPDCSTNFFKADLSVKEEAIAFANWCLELMVPDVLINNAGIYINGNVIDEPEGNLELQMNTNLYSAYHVTRQLVPAMIRNGGGHIFNMCSIASLHAYPGGGGYSISKYALHGFSQNLRNELKPHGVKVTSVFPGAVLTDSWSGFDNSNGRIMEAADIAEMIYAATLLSPQAVVEDIVLRPQLGDL